MKRKQVEFADLKIGDTFRFRRAVWRLDMFYCCVNVRTGYVLGTLRGDTLVTPVKVEIKVKE